MSSDSQLSPPPLHGPASGFFPTSDGREVEIRDVWASNLEEEMSKIRDLVEKYNFIAMDTEFPGVVVRPNGEYGNGDAQYQTLKCNVDMLKLIQLGLSFTDAEGNWAEGCTCWQFNFKFSLTDDTFAHDSIELLKGSGIDFEKFENFGIDIHHFGELMTMSGLVLTEDVKWISFHGSYDFAYLLKTLTCTDLPMDESGFMDLLHTFFPCLYDVKYMMTSVEGMYGGLAALGDTLQVERVGPMHQAGSDSLLTAQTYFALIKKHLGPVLDDKKFRGQLFGLGDNHTKYKGKYSSGSGSASAMVGGSHGGIAMQLSHGVHYPQGMQQQQSQIFMPYSMSGGSTDEMGLQQEGY